MGFWGCACSMLALCACNGGSVGVSGSDGGSFSESGVPLFDGFSGETAICAETNVKTTGAVPTVQLLVDQSKSMNDPFGTTSRWTALYNTLMNPTTGVVKRLEGRVVFGLTLYTTPGGSGGTCPRLVDVPAALNNFGAIDAVYGKETPGSSTPTGEALDAVQKRVQGLAAQGPKIIILATDGEPNGCSGGFGGSGINPAGRQRVVTAAQASFAAGIRVFVISVGDQVGASHLQEVANAGIGLAPTSPQKATYYQALVPDSLVRAFDTIVGGVVGCSFKLEGKGVHPAFASKGKVWLDNQPIAFETQWKLVDSTTLELLGDACDKVKAGVGHEVRGTFPCGAVIK